MKKFLPFVILVFLSNPAWSQIQLPEDLRLAASLDDSLSEFGDEFYNFPSEFQGRAEPGSTYLSGWIVFEFEPPEGEFADFTLRFESVGTAHEITFPGGQIYELNDNRAEDNPHRISRGRVNLRTGEVDQLEVHAIFRNSVISRVTRNIRIPFAFLNDYPPAVVPIDLPYSDSPPTLESARFSFDSTGEITAFEFHGETEAPVTVFPRLGLFPPYAFAEEDLFYFANPDDCLPGTSRERCLSVEDYPDGVALPPNAFFHPHLDLVTREVYPLGESREVPSCLTEISAPSAGFVRVDDRLYHVGGIPPRAETGRIDRYDPETGRWSLESMISNPTRRAHTTGWKGQLYLMGGVDAEGLISNRMRALDTSRLVWEELEPMPFPTFGGAVAGVGDEIYLLGGWSPGPRGTVAVSDRLQIFDTITGSWSTETLPVPVADAAIAAIGTDLFLLNGRASENEIMGSLWILNTLTKTWTQGPETPIAVYDATAAYLEGRVYLVGGRGEIEGEPIQVLRDRPARVKS